MFAVSTQLYKFIFLNMKYNRPINFSNCTHHLMLIKGTKSIIFRTLYGFSPHLGIPKILFRSQKYFNPFQLLAVICGRGRVALAEATKYVAQIPAYPKWGTVNRSKKTNQSVPQATALRHVTPCRCEYVLLNE